MPSLENREKREHEIWLAAYERAYDRAYVLGEPTAVTAETAAQAAKKAVEEYRKIMLEE